MSKKYQPKTSGVDFMYQSLASFNGNNHCIKLNANTFFESYINYKGKKGELETAKLVVDNKDLALRWIESVLSHAKYKTPPHKDEQWWIWEDLNGWLKKELDLIVKDEGQLMFDKLLVNATPADFKESVQITKLKNLYDKEARGRYLYAVLRNKSTKIFE